jgi:hypothetical protein
LLLLAVVAAVAVVLVLAEQLKLQQVAAVEAMFLQRLQF